MYLPEVYFKYTTFWHLKSMLKVYLNESILEVYLMESILQVHLKYTWSILNAICLSITETGQTWINYIVKSFIDITNLKWYKCTKKL